MFCTSFSCVSAIEIKLYLWWFSLICFVKVCSSKETTWSGICCKYLMRFFSGRAASDLIRRIKTKNMTRSVPLTAIHCTHDPGPDSDFHCLQIPGVSDEVGLWSARSVCALSALGRWAVELTGEDGSGLAGAETLTSFRRSKVGKSCREQLALRNSTLIRLFCGSVCHKIRMRGVGNKLDAAWTGSAWLPDSLLTPQPSKIPSTWRREDPVLYV